MVYTILAALATAAACVACLGCSGGSAEYDASTGSGGQVGMELEAAADQAADRTDGPLIVFFGDSLTAAHELAEEDGFPARIEETLRAEGVACQVLNAGVSGDTTAGGEARVDWILKSDPDVVVVSFGANDGLRGLDLGVLEENLRAICTRVQAHGARVLLCGMKLPPNYGPGYVKSFEELYPRVAADLDLPLVPFLLEGVGGVPELNLPDGMHPNPEGYRRVAEVVLPHLRPILGELSD